MAEAASPTLLGRVVDYIFGRNTLIGLASLMLLSLCQQQAHQFNVDRDGSGASFGLRGLER